MDKSKEKSYPLGWYRPGNKVARRSLFYPQITLIVHLCTPSISGLSCCVWGRGTLSSHRSEGNMSVGSLQTLAFRPPSAARKGVSRRPIASFPANLFSFSRKFLIGMASPSLYAKSRPVVRCLRATGGSDQVSLFLPNRLGGFLR